MSPTEPDPNKFEELEGHYHQALALTKGLLSEVRAHGNEIDLESLAARLEEREAALALAARVAKEADLDVRNDDRTEPKCINIKQVARETLDLGEELICLLNRVRKDSKDELDGFEAGSKLIKGYKGFKAGTALRFDRQV